MNPKRSHSQIGLSQAGRLDRTTSNQMRKLYQLCFDTAKNEGNLKQYKKIKYMGVIYKIGDFLEIYHLGNAQHYVTKLVSIASIVHDEKSEDSSNGNIDLKCPMIEVEWYLRKKDLQRNPKFDKDWKQIISEAEVFASGQKFALPVEAIVSKCEVLSIKEYQELGFIESSIYFSRASYNIETETLTPSVEEWEPKYCYCQKPCNPDLEWRQCEKCKQWFHEDCFFTEENSGEVCVGCQKREVSVKKKKK